MMKNEVVFITGGASGLGHRQEPQLTHRVANVSPPVMHAGFGECTARKVVAASGRAVIADIHRAQSIARELGPNCVAIQCSVT